MKKLWDTSKWLIICMMVLIALLVVLLIKRDQEKINGRAPDTITTTSVNTMPAYFIDA